MRARLRCSVGTAVKALPYGQARSKGAVPRGIGGDWPGLGQPVEKELPSIMREVVT